MAIGPFTINCVILLCYYQGFVLLFGSTFIKGFTVANIKFDERKRACGEENFTAFLGSQHF